MDITQLNTGLTKKFEQSRIVFWHDPEQSFTAQLADLSVARDDKPVCIINMEHESQLEIRRHIELLEPDTAFLLYWPSEEPLAARDWLLDMRRYSGVFYADAASILLNELGLTNMALREHLAKRKSFFASRERTAALKKKLDSRSGVEDPLSLDFKMICVALTCNADYQSLMMELGARLLSEDESEQALNILDKYELQSSFWSLMSQHFGYQVESPNLPSFRDLYRRILVSECYEMLEGNKPQWMQGVLLGTSTGRANAMTLLGQWRDSSRHNANYATLADEIARQLELAPRLEPFAAVALQNVFTFEQVEQSLIRGLANDVLEGDVKMNPAEWAALVSRRRQGYWCQTVSKYNALYMALTQAYELFEMRRAFPDGFHYHSAQAMYQAYETELFQFDRCYRLFNEALEQLQGMAVDLLAALSTRIEELYVHWYLYQLGLAWDGLLGKEQRLADWQLGVPKQSRFYDSVIRARFMQAGVKRQFVIISDALRYEIAHELQTEINQAKRFSAQLTSQLSVLPSYTQLGMAALLPHDQIDFSANGSTVLVDGMSSAGLDNRSAILAKVGGLAISAKQLLSWTRPEANQAVGEARVIYIYHDVIDAIGDKAATELQTFKAARQAISELNSLVAKVINGFGATRVVITADHGFLSQISSPEDGVRSSLLVEPPGTLEAKKRYLLGRNLPDNENVWHGQVRDMVKGDSGMEFWLPRGVSRFHFVGGARFVHGGAMLQEICVPVLEVQELRGKKQQQNEKVKVGVVPAQSAIKLVNAIDKIRFLQTDAVGERHKARALRIFVADKDGLTVSAVEKLLLDSAATSLDQRQQDVVIKLTGQQFKRTEQYQLVLLDDEEGLELARYPITIDLMFQDDFGF